MLRQKDAVYNAIMGVFEEHEVNFEHGMIAKDLLTTEMKKQVNNILFEGFKEGKIELSKSYDDLTLKKYVAGLQNNWLRKDTRYNDGVPYEIKNKGSRAGSQDPQIKNLRALKKQVADAKDIQAIDEAIAKRLAEIKPKAEVKIDVDTLPEELRHLVPTSTESQE